MERGCAVCGASLNGKRSDAFFCSKACQRKDEYARTSDVVKARNAKLRLEKPDVLAARRKVYNRKHNLMARFGLSVADYDAMLAAQGGVCAICRKKPPHNNLAVDHEHGTGRVRGLLCTRCNQGLGSFRDDPYLMREAASYTERSQMRRRLEVEEEYGVYYVRSRDGMRVQSASLEGALTKAAKVKGATHTDGFLEIRSTQDAVDVLETLLGRKADDEGASASYPVAA